MDKGTGGDRRSVRSGYFDEVEEHSLGNYPQIIAQAAEAELMASEPVAKAQAKIEALTADYRAAIQNRKDLKNADDRRAALAEMALSDPEMVTLKLKLQAAQWAHQIATIELELRRNQFEVAKLLRCLTA